MRNILSVFAVIMLMGCVHTTEAQKKNLDKEKILKTVEEVALQFDYYDEISAAIPNFYEGDTEIGGQCGDYALAFVNLWNSRNTEKALLVIQQQGIEQFPDGLYEVVGKDLQELPFLAERSISMLYIWNNISGIAHPELGGYIIRLVKEIHVKSHLGIDNWESNGPHVWAVIDDVSIDPVFADFGTLPVIGLDTYEER